MTVRLIVADDHTLVRQGIVKLLEGLKEIEVVGEASSGFEAVSKAQELNADAVLMDLYMPKLDGVAATRLLKQQLPLVKVVIMTVSEEEDDLFEALQAGARGYVVKNVDINTLLEQLRRVLAGGVAMTEDLTTKLVAGLARRGSGSINHNYPKREEFTEREKEVLALVAKGSSNKEIASDLIISENTVRAHVRTLMQKLHMENRTQLAVFSVYEGYGLDSRKNGQHGRSAQAEEAARF